MTSKIEKFNQLHDFDNVVEHTNNKAKNKLAKFIDNQETVLELACGGGDYTLALADQYKNKKFIGIDIQGERLWFGASRAKNEKLDNVLFFRVHIHRLLDFIEKNTIDEIWITFPDPYPKKKRYIKRRLTSPDFLNIYKQILKLNGVIHLKTDDKNLFEYSKEIIETEKWITEKSISDIYTKKNLDEVLKIKTYFELKHLENNKKIYYLKFSLPKK